MTVTTEAQGLNDRPAWVFPLVAATEGAFLVVAAKSLELLGYDLQALPINPYLACIILMAAQHGVFGGVFTAALAISFSYFGGWPSLVLGQSYFDYMLVAWTTPLVWLATALGVGVITSRRARKQARAELALERAQKAQTLIEYQYNILATRARKLERFAAGLDAGHERARTRRRRVSRRALANADQKGS